MGTGRLTILRLTSSDDFNERIPPKLRSAAVAESAFTALTGEPARTVVRRIWPTPGLPALLEKWMAEHQPDVVILRAASYWVTFESVPLRLRRWLGPLGGPLAAAGDRASRHPWLATNPAFHAGRRLLLRTIGGDTTFTVPGTLDVLDACLRRILAHEGVTLVVRGPQNAVTADPSPKSIARAERRRQQLHAGLRALCERRHLAYLGFDRPVATMGESGLFDADRLHSSEDLHRLRGEDEGRLMAEAWLRDHGRAGAAGPAAYDRIYG